MSELQIDIDPENPPSVSPEIFSGMTLACNMKSKEEVDSVMESAEKAGGTIVKHPQTVFWGGYFKDLDGYYWEVAYSDSWQFDDQNMLILDED